MKIAVDFDGTIVEHEYPKIGKVRPFAFQTLKMLQEKGHLLVLWTYRSGRLLDEAVEFCRENGVEFYAVNSDYPGQVFDETMSRKIDCDYYIDDRNIGGLPSWGEIYHFLHPEENGQGIMGKPKKKKPFWKR
jgi:hydroxymethylpyrimidine pyrophosphatase-like HAD family hydrolase